MPRQPQMMISDDEDEDPYAEDLYDMYDRSYNNMNYTSSSTRSRSRPQKPMYIEEEEEEENPYSPDSVYEVDFEMVPSRGARRPSNAGMRGAPPSSVSRRSVPTIKTIRVKVHADDTRYVFIDPNVRFDTFSAQIRDKFALRQNFKIKIRDDNDMITMSDQEDLQMAISSCSTEAKRERKEMGKMEVSKKLRLTLCHSISDIFRRCGCSRLCRFGSTYFDFASTSTRPRRQSTFDDRRTAIFLIIRIPFFHPF